MCYSAEVSFGASAVLVAGGIWSRSLALAPRERPIATFPLLFGIQQFAEGVVWVGIGNDQPDLVAVFSYIYAFFALMLWPILVPLAVFRVEPERGRRRIQQALWVVGMCVAVLISGSLARNGLSTSVVGGHLAYRVQLTSTFELVGFYFLAVSAPCVSSHRYLRWFGVLLVVSLALALARHAMNFVSLWCLAAALLSILVIVHLRVMQAARRETLVIEV